MTSARASLERLKKLAKSPLAQGVTVALLCAAAIGVFLWVAKKHYGIQHWLVWVYVQGWAVGALFTAACLTAGVPVVDRLAPRMPLREKLVMGLTVGVVLFYVGASLAGMAGLFGGTFFFAFPLGLIAAGAYPCFRLYQRMRPALRRLRRRPLSALEGAALVLGLVALAAIYVTILTPENAAFDSRFYHLGLAQQYLAEGGIYPTKEAWMPAGIPHLASILYTWAFLAPWADAFTRIELAAHIEWVMFLWTLASLPSLVRWMAPGVNARLSWAAIFLFPGILIYDSGLSIAADHVCAFFAVPIVLALRRAFRELDPKECVLLGFGMSGALLTKYQGMMLCAGPGLVVVARALWLGIARARGRIRHLGFVYGPLTLLGVGVVLTAPHWAKNWAWYGDPLFPFLIGKLDPGRYPKEAYELFDNWFAAHTAQWKPKGTLTEKLLELLGASANFSLAPHDWPKFHGSRPVFGSLYTLLIPALFALRARGRTFLVVLFSQLAIAVWFWTLHQDRYLQNFLPWMAAVVAVALLLAFRAHWLARVGVGALVAVQLLYGADVYFIPSHAMLHELPIEDVADLFQKHTKSKTHDRDDLLTGAFFQIGRVLPPDAKVVLHETNPRLGLFRSAINDFAPWQWGLRYVDYESPAALHDTLRAWGVTHIAWQPKKSRAYDSLGSDLRFFQLVTRHLGPPKKLGGWQVAPLPEEPKPTKLNDVVAYLGCNGVYQKGLHELQDLRVIGQKPPAQYRNLPAFEPLEKGNADALLAKADFVITHSGCPDQPSKQALAPFEEVARRGKPETLYIRR